MKTIRLAIIGCGKVTERHHLPALRRVPALQVVALADAAPARAEALGREFGVARRHTDYADLLRSRDVDAVAVCVPPRLHPEIAVAALQHGKHLFIEKPLALSLAECDTVAECAAARPDCKIMVGFNLRWHRLIRQMRKLIEDGELGDVKLVRTVFTTADRRNGQVSGWRSSRESGGGALLDLGVHHFDLVRFLLRSEPEEIHCSGNSSEETVAVMMGMTNRAQVVSSFSQTTGESHSIEIYGERGWVRVSCYQADGLERGDSNRHPGGIGSRFAGLVRMVRTLPRILYQSSRGGEYGASYVNAWKHFAHAIAEDRPVECSLIDGGRSIEIALAAAESSATRRTCRLENVPL
jgi:myo-inositol 2-dehydrogenase / D-chiro-inositol 1-dehydrogenase